MYMKRSTFSVTMFILLLNLFLAGCMPQSNVSNSEQNEEEQVDPRQGDSSSKAEDAISYKNSEYGFIFSLPETWGNYQIVMDTWEGTTVGNSQNDHVERGPFISIRHPEWTSENQ